MRLKLILLAVLLLAAGALPAAAQNSLCQIDVSQINALLTRAQAASAAGDQPLALALVERADTLLASIENRCDLPQVAVTVELGEVVSTSEFSVTLPPGWSADTEGAASIGGLLIGTSPEAAGVMALAEPLLESGHAGGMITFGTPSELTFGGLRSGDLDALARYYQILLGSQYLLGSEPSFLLLDGRAAAEIGFSGAGFEGHLILVEVASGRYAALASAAPRGELAALIPVAQAVAASITVAE